MENTASTNGIAEIRENLSRYVAQGQVSQSQVAREVGVSKTAISLFLKGNYTGNNEELARKIEQYLRMDKARNEVIKEPEICLDVCNTADILSRAKIAHMHKNILLIHGPAGCGKTTALKHYAQQNNGVIFVEADVTINSPRSMLMLILSTMGEDIRGTTAILMQRIITKLTGTNRLIVIDEAQHLTTKTFDTIRAINDKAKVGIVYAGNPEILRRMYGRQEEELDQLYSRIVYRCALKNNYTKDEIGSIYSGFKYDDKCLKYLHKTATNRGGLRVMVNQCCIAQNIAKGNGEAFSTQHLDEAAIVMGIGGRT